MGVQHKPTKRKQYSSEFKCEAVRSYIYTDSQFIVFLLVGPHDA